VRVVFATYDGVLAGPGRSQVVPYVRGLAERGHDMRLLSYEQPDLAADPSRTGAVEQALGPSPWTRLDWKRSAPGDLANGLRALRRTVREHRAELVHARGYVPALLARVLRVPYVFDMRGFWPDERVDGGLWSAQSTGYRTWKRIERSLCRRARSVVVLTERARDELRRLGLVPEPRPVHVIPTCVDLDRFRPVPESERPPEARGGARRFVILGGTGTWYLPDAMLDLGARALARDSAARLHVLTQDDPAPIREGLAARGVDPERALVRSVAHEDVPAWLSGATAGIALLRATWSKSASCPTKIGEMLACGVPLIVSSGIGDVDALFEDERVGVTVAGTSPEALEGALDRLEALTAAPAQLHERCRDVAARRFASSRALDAYERAYAEAAA
jgi:glycosyltransferase involved in cell wall biosynthesis